MAVIRSLNRPGTTLCSSINKTDRHDLTEILLKVALNIIQQTSNPYNDHNIYRLFYITILSTTCIVQCQDTCYVHNQVKINTSVKLSENIYFVQRYINLENFNFYFLLFFFFFTCKTFSKICVQINYLTLGISYPTKCYYHPLNPHIPHTSKNMTNIYMLMSSPSNWEHTIYVHKIHFVVVFK
jgi:hypothetical protein